MRDLLRHNIVDEKAWSYNIMYELDMPNLTLPFQRC